ncbi:TolC family protein (plasmid) [Photobacterium damselae subsp. damselae]|uniref:TolC family protein n=1 Tax=Photobacterium damselae TaxID=38293 RepID=UPI001F3B0DC0|nr:TolC family protein [Photobacterium damselae]UJZ96545.1 TolC family protein [Photobacterium damselae subsp. damselae]UKA00516.1 TolC family protein [Photobacterium damselae subsp. damselae]
MADSSSFSYESEALIPSHSSDNIDESLRIRNYIDNVKFIEIYELVMSNSSDVRIKELEADIKELNNNSNSFATFPTLGVGVSTSISKKDSINSYYGSLSTGTSLNSIISKLSETSKSDILSKMKAVNLSIVSSHVFSDISKIVYEIEEIDKTSAILGEIITLQREKAEIIELLFHKGKVSESKWLDSIHDLNLTEDELDKKNQRRKQILYKLKMDSGLELKGDDYSFNISESSPLLSGFSFYHITKSNDVKLKEFEMALSYADARNANLLFIPEVSISIGTDLLEVIQDITMSSFLNSISVAFPLDFSDKINMKESRIKTYRKSVYEYKKSIYEGVLKLSKAYFDYNEARSKYLYSMEQIKVREAELKKIALKYQLGSVSYLDFLDFSIDTLRKENVTYEDKRALNNKRVDLVVEAGYAF